MATDHLTFDPERDLAIPAVDIQEVKRFLDAIDGKRPYGSRWTSHVQTLLEALAKDVEVRAFYGEEALFDDWKLDALSKALGRPVSSYALNKAVLDFLQPRRERAMAIYRTRAERSTSTPSMP